MRKAAFGALIVALIAGGASEARADISFSLDQGDVQGENLLFPVQPDGFTVQGITNQSPGTVYNISSDELLTTPSQGQARVEAVDGGLSLFLITPDDPNILFDEFEANLRIEANTGGTFTVMGCNQFGSFDSSAPFSPSVFPVDGGACEAQTFNLTNGENFFVLTVSDQQLLSGVRVETSGNVLLDVRQIRIGGSQLAGGEDPVTPTAPEPSSILLLGGGLLAAGVRSYRRRLARKTAAI